MEGFKFVHEESRMANVIRFSIETTQGLDFWKTSGYFLAEFFPQTTNVFQQKYYKKIFSYFFFASFDSFKALLGCLEKLETFANDLV